MGSRQWLYFGGFVVTGILAVGAALMGLLEGLSALSRGVSADGEFVLLALLGAAAEWIVLVVVFGLIALVFLTATVVSILRSASLPRDDRLTSVVEWLERKYPTLQRFNVTDKVRPTIADRKQQLKERYVDGEISEAQFEREMEQLMDDAESKKSTQHGSDSAFGINEESR